jgi:hypothetical protein
MLENLFSAKKMERHIRGRRNLYASGLDGITFLI